MQAKTELSIAIQFLVIVPNLRLEPHELASWVNQLRDLNWGITCPWISMQTVAEVSRRQLLGFLF